MIFEENLSIEGANFQPARETFDAVLAEMLRKMAENRVDKGKVSLTADVLLLGKNVDDGSGFREALVPIIKIRVGSSMARKTSSMMEIGDGDHEILREKQGWKVASVPDGQMTMEL